MSNGIIEKILEKQELLKAYDQCVKAFAREYVDKGTINRELWDKISKIQRALREHDILEEVKKQLEIEKIIGIPFLKQNHLKSIPKSYMNIMPKKELCNTIYIKKH